METTDITLKKLSKIAIVALIILLVGAIIFFRERIFFADAAYVSFNIINYSDLAIQCNRYGSFITQIVPYLGQQFHLPLTSVLISYSASFYLFYLVVIAMLVYRCKQYGLAVLAALYYFLIFSDSFFWISEIPQGIGWMFLLFGVTISLGKKKAPFILIAFPFIILAFLTISTHFVILIPTVFLWVYFIVEKNNWPFSWKTTILLSCLLVAVIAFKFILALSGAQAATGDGPHLYGVTHVSFKDIFNSFATPVVRMFFYNCLVNYWAATLVFIIGIISLFRNGNKILAAWVLVCFLGYSIIMGLTYGDLDQNVLLFHIESEWTSIGVIMATPFVFGFLPKLKLANASILLTGIFIVRLAYISTAIPMFTWRTHFQENILAKMKEKGITKVALLREYSIKPKYLLDWSSSNESLLMSAMNGDIPNRTFVFIDSLYNEPVKQLITTGKGFYNIGDMLPLNDLKHEYFNIDTTQPYKVMLYEDLIK